MINSTGVAQAIYRLEAEIGRGDTERYLQNILHGDYDNIINKIDTVTKNVKQSKKESEHKPSEKEQESTVIGVRKIVR